MRWLPVFWWSVSWYVSFCDYILLFLCVFFCCFFSSSFFFCRVQLSSRAEACPSAPSVFLRVSTSPLMGFSAVPLHPFSTSVLMWCIPVLPPRYCYVGCKYTSYSTFSKIFPLKPTLLSSFFCSKIPIPSMKPPHFMDNRAPHCSQLNPSSLTMDENPLTAHV